MSKPIIFDAQKLVREQMEMTVEIRIVNLRWVKIRLWIAVQLCRLAAWIGGYGLKINQEVGVIITDKDIVSK
jgi:hypothetical protein